MHPHTLSLYNHGVQLKHLTCGDCIVLSGLRISARSLPLPFLQHTIVGSLTALSISTVKPGAGAGKTAMLICTPSDVRYVRHPLFALEKPKSTKTKTRAIPTHLPHPLTSEVVDQRSRCHGLPSARGALDERQRSLQHRFHGGELRVVELG